MSRQHLHAVTTTENSIEAEHQAWHDTREPCVFCGRRAWHSCPVFVDGSKTGADCYGERRDL